MEEEFAAMAQSQAIKRVEVPEDLVGALSFLTSDDAGFITGQTLICGWRQGEDGSCSGGASQAARR